MIIRFIFCFIDKIMPLLFLLILCCVTYQTLKSEIKNLIQKSKKSNKKDKIKKSAKELSIMTPKERQDEFFNACWEEIEKSKNTKNRRNK